MKIFSSSRRSSPVPEDLHWFLKIFTSSWRSSLVPEDFHQCLDHHQFPKIFTSSWRSSPVLEDHQHFLKIITCSWRSSTLLKDLHTLHANPLHCFNLLTPIDPFYRSDPSHRTGLFLCDSGEHKISSCKVPIAPVTYIWWVVNFRLWKT